MATLPPPDMFCPAEPSPETRTRFERERKKWPLSVSRIRTLAGVEKRLAAKQARIKSHLWDNEARLLRAKRLLLKKPRTPMDTEDKMMVFARFLFGGDMACAMTKEEKARAREEETMQLMEVDAWLERGMAWAAAAPPKQR